MKNVADFKKRSDLHKYISEKLLTTAFKCIDENGKSLVDPSEGDIWPGTVILVMGEVKRLLREDISNVDGKDFIQIALSLLSDWETKNEIDTCFVGIGLSSWGALNDNHAIYSKLSDTTKKYLYQNLAVTREFVNNWEAFNSCIEAGNSILKPEADNTIHIHVKKILDEFTGSGYFDDSNDKGNYNSYGLMSLNYCLKALELLPDSNEFKQDLIDQFRPHFLTYFNLVKQMTYPDGTGWVFGRSAGVLGQLQYLIFLEQALAHKFIDGDDAAWARGAVRKITAKMIELFWDEEKQWFCFRDDHHVPYSYRKTFPMHWDLLRYFMQAMEYALIDEEAFDQKETPLQGEKKSVEIITNKEKQTSIYIWSDGIDQFVLPIMGGPGRLTTDCLPKPTCRGIIEGVTENLKPIWVPVFTIKDQSYMPANYASSTKVLSEDGWDIYEVSFEKMFNVDKTGQPFANISIKTSYCFKSGSFKRVDCITVNSEEVVIDKIEMEILQAKAHPKRVAGYGKVYQVKPQLQATFNGLNLSDSISTNNDPDYRNYFGLPVSKWVVSGKNISLAKGDYSITTEISW